MLFFNTKRMVQAVALLAVLVIGQFGCVPTWLPDSSGFVFIKQTTNPVSAAKEGQLVHFDVKTKKSRVVLDNVGGDTVWPAVSPDGKRIAVARIIGDPDKVRTLQIVLYDFQGKEIKKGEEHAWTLGGDKQLGPTAALLFWTPKEDTLIVSDGSQSAFYDVKGDKLQVFKKAIPVMFGGTPVRPDGKGVLLARGDNEKPRLVFVDWRGAEQEFDAEPFLTAMYDGAKARPTEPLEEIASLAALAFIFPSGWQGNDAWLGNQRDKATLSIDLANKKVVVTEPLKALLKKANAEDKPPIIKMDGAGDLSIQIVPNADEAGEKKDPQSFRIVVVNHKTGNENVVEAKIPGLPLIAASPDGKYLALSCLNPRLLESAGFILVLDKKGEVVSRIAMEK